MSLSHPFSKVEKKRRAINSALSDAHYVTRSTSALGTFTITGFRISLNVDLLWKIGKDGSL